MNFLFKGALSAAVISLSISCGSGVNQNDETANDTVSAADLRDATIIKPSIINTDQVLANQIERIYSDYLQIQSSLAEDQFSKASVAADQLNKCMNSFEDSTLPENQRQAYSAHITAIKESAARILSSKNIEQQRIAFEPLSAHLYDLLKSFGSNRPVYETHCPMAFDSKGASWVSDQAAIHNPYFGNKMLDCGEVKSIIKR